MLTSSLRAVPVQHDDMCHHNSTAVHECILQIGLESMVSAYTMFIFEALHSERMQEFIGSRLIPYEQRFVFYEMGAGALSDSASPQPCGRPVDTVVVVQQSL